MILKPGREPEAEAIFSKWGLDFAVIGKTTDTGRMIVTHKGAVEADLPVATLANSAPLYERPWVPTVPPKIILPEWVPAPNAILGALKTMMGWPAPVLAPLDLGAVRPHGDGRHRAAPRRRRGGGARARHEQGPRRDLRRARPAMCWPTPSWAPSRRWSRPGATSIAVGADPLAITDNMNFGNPERPEIMGQFVGAIQGMAEACRVLNYPVVSRQRLALQRDQRRRHPADAGHRRRRARARRRAHGRRSRLKGEGDLLVVIGRESGHLGQSLYQLIHHRQARGRAAAGRPRRRDQGRQPRARADPRGQGGAPCTTSATAACWWPIAEMALAGGIGVAALPLRGQAAGARRLVRRGPGPLRPGGRSDARRGDHRAGATAGAAGARRRARRRRARWP